MIFAHFGIYFYILRLFPPFYKLFLTQSIFVQNIVVKIYSLDCYIYIYRHINSDIQILNLGNFLLVFYNNKKIIIDFVIWSQNGEEIFNYSERGYKRSQKVKYFKSLTSVVAFNHSYLIPGYIEEWLCFRYGIDWKVPKTYKGDWKEECGDISLLSC